MRQRRLLASAVLSPLVLRSLVLSSLGFAATAAAQVGAPQVGASQVEEGELLEAPYRIEIPADWTGGLVMYAHGYEVAGTPSTDFDDPRFVAFRQVFLDRGFAFAQSAYSAQGWAVKEGLEDTEALRRYFVRRHGAPERTFITGHSMGGLLTVASLERYPEVYDGGLPLCGPLSPSLHFFESHLYDLLAAFGSSSPGSIRASTIRPIRRPSSSTGRRWGRRSPRRPRWPGSWAGVSTPVATTWRGSSSSTSSSSKSSSSAPVGCRSTTAIRSTSASPTTWR